MSAERVALQDGGDFVDMTTREPIVLYPHVTSWPSAMAARAKFLAEHPEYRMATEEECFGGTCTGGAP